MIGQRYHIFRDPIHNFIRVYDVEKAIIDSLPFQRLRRIRQLGLSNLVYQGADHYRFAHSLGTMEFATKIFDTLAARHQDELAEMYDWNDQQDFERNRQLLRLAALLHDIGHPPFSHASEDLFPDKQSHETYGARILISEPIRGIIEGYSQEMSITLNDLIELLGPTPLGEKAFLKQILCGEVDADRMDYLLRDSLYTGVKYGLFDHERLVETTRLVEDKEHPGSLIVAVEEGGKHAAEGMIVARYFMFTQVYFHAVRRIYDIHLTDSVREMLGEEEAYPSDIGEYLKYDDIKVMNWIKEKAEEGTSESAGRIWQRRHFECIAETLEHPQGSEVDEFHQRIQVLRRRFGDDAILVDRADKLPYNFDTSLLLIQKRHTGEVKPFASESRLVGSLERIFQLRAYSDRDIVDEARKLYYRKATKHA